MGAIADSGQPWHEPGSSIPDGSFLIVRWNADRLEILSDVVATRTAWWVLTEDLLIASSSQRAIVRLLGSFEFNRDVIPWMLSCGTLGPLGGWDTRLNRLGPDARLVLDRTAWTAEPVGRPASFSPAESSDETQQAALEEALLASAAALNA